MGPDGWLDRAVELITGFYQGIPTAYLTGWVEYAGRAFKSDSRALAIRAYSVPMVLGAVEHFRDRTVRALEIGCGAGAAICTLAAELEGEFVGTDVDPQALTLARENAELHGVRAEFVVSDLFAGLTGTFDLIYANLPRQNPEEPVAEAEWEPGVALYDPTGRRNGIYQRFFTEVQGRLTDQGMLYLEGPDDPRLFAALPGEPVTDADGDVSGKIFTAEQVSLVPTAMDELWNEATR
ncbi:MULTISPECIES: methyltransferase domain-containing protein [Streptomyces]|uniref:methyltransferase domain-containing protein n=1 Tax=Streptomyces TaxID=1883 RepID=UPI0036C98EA0